MPGYLAWRVHLSFWGKQLALRETAPRQGLEPQKPEICLAWPGLLSMPG
jgi:hypothetical protein